MQVAPGASVRGSVLGDSRMDHLTHSIIQNIFPRPVLSQADVTLYHHNAHPAQLNKKGLLNDMSSCLHGPASESGY